jgi:radical SAM superfamily enzyme YgiQ (UPF0313 family)
MMRRANFRKVFLGIETPVEESLKEAQKGQNTRRSLLDSVHRIQSYGMQVMAGFIVGFDHDPVDIFQRQIDFIRQSAIPMAMVGLLTALPETQLWRRLSREGRLLIESSGNNMDGALNFIPTMDRETLLEGYRSILRTIYSPVEYYNRAWASLKNTVTADRPPSYNFNAANLLSFARVVYRLGILDSSRRNFWQFLNRALKARRGLLADAVILAAMGYHFRKVTEEFCD